MADRDPAFLWETEALRTSSTPIGGAEGSRDWVTVRQASDLTGVPVNTLRNWARKGRVPSSLEDTDEGLRRLVSVEGVRARARLLGQEVREPARSPQAAPPLTPGESGADSQPPGTMLVPVDAWNKMLTQLGNLHEAGQQLAEARERAARAETEATFLRERLAELRLAAVDNSPEPPVDAVAEAPRASSTRMPRFSAYLWRLAASGRRKK